LATALYVIEISPVRDDLDLVWRALASPIRRRMLDCLRAGPRTTGWLAARFPRLSRFAVMQHLGVLETAGLVVPRREGRERWNHLNRVPIRRIYERWVRRYDEPFVAALTTIQARAEAGASGARASRSRPEKEGSR
jgi:DNA-binding transcriptional ArsR family regulator